MYQPDDYVHVRFSLTIGFPVTVHREYRCQIEQYDSCMEILKNAIYTERAEQLQSLLILIYADAVSTGQRRR